MANKSQTISLQLNLEIYFLASRENGQPSAEENLYLKEGRNTGVGAQRPWFQDSSLPHCLTKSPNHSKRRIPLL